MSQPVEATSYLYSTNERFLAELYARYLVDSRSVDPSWQVLFAELGDSIARVAAELAGATWAPSRSRVVGAAEGLSPHRAVARTGDASNGATASDAAQVSKLIQAYRVHGHSKAALDPLGLSPRETHPDLDPTRHGFGEPDWDRPLAIVNEPPGDPASLREMLALLDAVYCGSSAAEFAHLRDSECRDWLASAIERGDGRLEFSPERRRALLERLAAAETIERFIDRRFPGATRFSLEGVDALIPALDEVIDHGAGVGMRELVIGMAHRGRINVLANIACASLEALFADFMGRSILPAGIRGSGDIRYHFGSSCDVLLQGSRIHLSLIANPSHLELVNPVVQGRVRAKQRQRGDDPGNQVVGLLIHGDASFTGQGVVIEALQLAQLPDFHTGGTIHIILDNQLGFTTQPSHLRSTAYPSDLAKSIDIPILHVNADDPEAVVRMTRLAVNYRYRFKRDIVIRLVGYRRYGHNEGDEPALTQPIMYQAIANHPTVREIYEGHLVGNGIVGPEHSKTLIERCWRRFDQAYEAAKTYQADHADWLEGAWGGLDSSSDYCAVSVTGVALDALQAVGSALVNIPAGFHLNRKVARQVEQKRRMLDAGEGVDWATAEALAVGTLCLEGTFVRLSGQDSSRGTFSQRHATLVDQETERRHVPLNNIAASQARFEIVDSPLSESSVLGFEYGQSTADPSSLIAWEAQYGDFANGAQAMIDEYIAGGEAKWLRMSGLVVLLPHGIEGAGPDHSSGRLERFLELCAENNLQVCNLTTPANYFHALRRQVRRTFRKPLVIMTPKSLLRSKDAVSRLDDMGPDTSFQPMFAETDALVDDAQVRRVVLCSGKIYYELRKARRERGIDHVALIRIEQLYPFPEAEVSRVIGRYANAETAWCQEEPRNMGAWHFVARLLEPVLAEDGRRLRLIGRPPAAAPETAITMRLKAEQAGIIDTALLARGLDR